MTDWQARLLQRSYESERPKRRNRRPSTPKRRYDGAESRQKVLDAIRAYWAEHGRSPSYRELSEATGVSVGDHLTHCLNHLVAQGAILWEPRTARSIRLAVTPDASTRLAELEAEIARLRAAHSAVFAWLDKGAARGWITQRLYRKLYDLLLGASS